MPAPIPFRQSLLRNLVPLVVVLGAAALATTFIGSRRAVRDLAQALTVADTERFAYQLNQYFEPVERGLLLTRRWQADGLIDIADPAAMNRLFVPLLEAYPSRASSFLLADESGREYMLLRLSNGWSIRLTDADARPGTATVITWEDAPETSAGSRAALDRANRTERTIEYDARNRPWYTGAVELFRSSGSTTIGPVYWTQPYEFFTTKDPGITAAVAFRDTDGRLLVAAFDVLLSDISRFTTGYIVGRTGGAIVLSEDQRVIGVPNSPLFRDEASIRSALLRRPDDLGWPLATDATAAFNQDRDSRVFRFESGGEPHWACGQLVELGPVRRLWVGVVVPEIDLVGDVLTRRIIILIATLAAVGFAVVRALFLARRYSTPIEGLVRQSDRIAAGDLATPEPVESSIAEVRTLAAAQERMRLAVQSLVKIEGDLRIARQIQRSMLPAQIPAIRGFSLAGWSEPADQTGGDIYDMVGFRLDSDGRHPHAGDACDGAMLLLADATGHGIGPALMATQVRAMFRMAIQGKSPLPDIAQSMNAQLCLDLTEGRFVTAWIAAVGRPDEPVELLAAGQGPTIHLRADGSADIFEADLPPLGVVSEFGPGTVRRITLAPGEALLAVSDGIYECFSPAGEQWGIDRLREVLSATRTRPAPQIVAAVRSAVEKHAAGRPADDDRTLVVIKRDA